MKRACPAQSRMVYLVALATLMFGGFSPRSGAASLAIANARGFPGKSSTLAVRLARATNITALQFDFQYDPTRSTLESLVRGPGLAGHQFITRQIAPGYLRVVGFSRSNTLLSTNGVAAEASFAVPSTELVGSGRVALQNVVMAKRSGVAESPVRTQNGGVFVAQVYRGEDGVAEFFVPAEVDETYVIQASQDLIKWTIISTNTAASEYLQAVDEDARIFPERFYRILPLSAVIAPTGDAVARSVSDRLITWLAPGRPYDLEASRDLVRWEVLRSGLVSASDLDLSQAINSQLPYRFFRLTRR